MTGRGRLYALVCGALACSPAEPDAVPGTGSTTTSTTGPSTTGTPTTTTTPELTSTTGGPTTDATDIGFIVAMDGGPADGCDPYAQDCRPGFKCTWWSNDGGGAWNATKCVPVAEDPAQFGEPCVAVGGAFSGDENCDIGLMCWNVDGDDNGSCIALCLGSDVAPTCPSGHVCTAGGDGLALCVALCDPLAQDCPGDDLCLPSGSNYACISDASGDAGQLHDPCEYLNTCDKGLLCVPSPAAVECDQAFERCCEPMCDLDQADPCPGAGQTCRPLYEPPLQGFEHVGSCGVPR